MTKTARVLIVDDHPLFRDGLATRISAQPDLEVCGEAAEEDEAMALVKQLDPDVVIVDICLQSGHGIDLIKRLKTRCPDVKALVVSAYDESLYAERALRAGALGYVNKQQSNEQVLEAIRTVLAGERYVSPQMTQRLVGLALGNSEQLQTPSERLTNRELEIFRLIGEGLGSTQIADRLHLSPHTVDSHRENMKRKLGLSSATELNRAAVQWLLENG